MYENFEGNSENGASELLQNIRFLQPSNDNIFRSIL